MEVYKETELNVPFLPHDSAKEHLCMNIKIKNPLIKEINKNDKMLIHLIH